MKDSIFLRIFKSRNQDLDAKKVTITKIYIEIIVRLKRDDLPCDNAAMNKLP